MSEEHRRRDRERGHLQHDAEHARPRKKATVVSYLAILFGAAFLLLLLTYFMQQRVSQEAIDGLQHSVNSSQSLGNLVEQNKVLADENKALKEQVDTLADQAETLLADVNAAQADGAVYAKQVQAMDWFWRVQRSYSRGAKGEAKTLAEKFETTGLPASLPTSSTAVPDAPSPAEQYDALLDALGMKETVTP